MRYTVYADSVLIHDSASIDPIMRTIDPKVLIQESAAGSFSFTLCPENPGYEAVKRMSSTIVVYCDSSVIWSGRVISESENFWKQRTFNCEGALAFLNDTNQPLKVYENYSMLSFLYAIFDIHNSKVSTNRQIKLGSVTVSDKDDSYVYKTEYKSTWDCFKESIFNRLGGHVRLRYLDGDPVPRLDYLKEYPNFSAQSIEFGLNLLNFTKNWDLTELATVIIPLGKQQEEEISDGIHDKTTIASVNNDSIYIENADAISAYGRIERIVDFGDVEDPSTLKALGNAYMTAQQFDEMVLEINAVDLHCLNPSIKSFKLFDQVECISKPHGLDRKFPISEISIPLNDPGKTTYKMGTVVQNNSLSAISAAKNDSIMNKIANMPSFTNLLDTAKRNATEILNMRTQGYVTIVEENEESQALVISDTPDWLHATKLWKFNMQGLGYSSNGGKKYDLAITMDGHIVADFIDTGILSDGSGFNYWNLSKGTFTLAYNTAFKNQAEQTITIVDVINMTDVNATNISNNATAITNNSKNITKSLNRQYGTFNLLHGTNAQMKLPSGKNDGEWSKGEWDGKLGSNALKTIVNLSGLPNSSITKGFNIKVYTNNQPSYFTQHNVVVSPEQVYVVSCYARALTGSSRLCIVVGRNVPGSTDSGKQMAASPLTSSWKRYTYTFMTTKNNSWTEAEKTNRRVHIRDNKIAVCFGVSGTANSECQIAGMTLERGNTATDWSDSVWDTSDFSKYTSNAEVVAFNKTLNNSELFRRITSGNAAQGLYMDKYGSLLINASYIKSGFMDATLIRTGILTDVTGNTIWDLKNSSLSTSNINITGGRIKFGSNKYSMTLNSSGLFVGEEGAIDYTYGVVIGASSIITLAAPTIYVSNSKYSVDRGKFMPKKTLTKTVQVPIVMTMNENGNFTCGKLFLEIVNGLIISVAWDKSNDYGGGGIDEWEFGIDE